MKTAKVSREKFALAFRKAIIRSQDHYEDMVEADCGFRVFVCTEKASFVKVKQDSK